MKEKNYLFIEKMWVLNQTLKSRESIKESTHVDP